MSNDLTDCMSDFDYSISSTSYNDIATYVRSFINGGFSSKKILFSTKILFNSVKKSGLSDHHKNMDYYEFCDGKKSDSRGFCDTPIQDFYNEGILRVEANLAGIFVEYAMSDDYDAKCGCSFQSTDKDKSFPILRLLADAGKTLFDDYQCDIKRVTIKPLGSHF